MPLIVTAQRLRNVQQPACHHSIDRANGSDIEVDQPGALGAGLGEQTAGDRLGLPPSESSRFKLIPVLHNLSPKITYTFTGFPLGASRMAVL